MNRLRSAVGLLMVAGWLVTPLTVLANAPEGGPPDYSGITAFYYTLIAVVLGYGVYDTFFKKS
ncbi:MAG: hypothetical protein NNA20_08600 [Nitrospira sp.]|nr:hypothetical protein [Nitrospira sp.]MCP9442641.1 hypothetical protein [Nitrospira sp.]